MTLSLTVAKPVLQAQQSKALMRDWGQHLYNTNSWQNSTQTAAGF